MPGFPWHHTDYQNTIFWLSPLKSSLWGLLGVFCIKSLYGLRLSTDWLSLESSKSCGGSYQWVRLVVWCHFIEIFMELSVICQTNKNIMIKSIPLFMFLGLWMFLQCKAINLAKRNLMLVMKGITATFALIYCSLGKWGKRGTLGPKELSPQTHPKCGQKCFIHMLGIQAKQWHRGIRVPSCAALGPSGLLYYVMTHFCG